MAMNFIAVLEALVSKLLIGLVVNKEHLVVHNIKWVVVKDFEDS
jgi:hypothetical protein